MSDLGDGRMADGPGAELERLHLEWQQLEHRRSRLSSRDTASASSQLSMPDLQSASRSSGVTGGSPRLEQRKLEEEREALRLALKKGRSGTLGASAAKRCSAISPPSHRQESQQQERDRGPDREHERELRIKVGMVEQENECLQAQLSECQKETAQLHRRLDEQDRDVSNLAADLHRTEAEAKHNKDMLTQLNDKQHASMLVLTREKGALEMQLNALKEENDSLRARTKNVLLNSLESENVLKAQKAAECVLHARDREGLEEEMQALRLQSSVALQQLKDKTQAVRLSADEMNSLRDQLAFMTSEYEECKQRIAAAEIRAYEAEDNVSKMLVDRMSSARKQERLSLLAASAVCAGHLRRWMGVSILRWAQVAMWSRYHRMHGLRIQRRGERHGVFKHFREWSTLIRQSKRYERLGFGADGLRKRITFTFLAEWRTELKLSREVRERQTQKCQLNVKHAFDAWAHSAQLRKKIQHLNTFECLDVHAAFQKWSSTTKLNRKNRTIMKNALLGTDLMKKQHFMELWRLRAANLRRQRGILGRAVSHTDYVLKKQAMHRFRHFMRIGRLLRRIAGRLRYHNVYEAFSTWSDIARDWSARVRAMRQKLRIWYYRICFRAWCKYRSFKSWSDKFLPKLVTKTDTKVLTDSFNDWAVLARNLSIMRRAIITLLKLRAKKALLSWHDVAVRAKVMQQRVQFALRAWLLKSAHGSFTAWRTANVMMRTTHRIFQKIERRTVLAIRTRSFHVWCQIKHMNCVARHIITRFSKKNLVKVVNSWSGLCAYKLALVKTAEKTLLKWFWKSSRGAFEQWVWAIYKLRKLRSVVRKICHLVASRSFGQWYEAVVLAKRIKKVIRTFAHHHALKAWRRWLEVVSRIGLARRAILVMRRAKAFSNSKKVFEAWVQIVELQKVLTSMRMDHQMRHVLTVWRRALVVERIFRQKVYNLLPVVVAQRDRVSMRRTARAWNGWARRSRSLKIKLKANEHSCRVRLAGGAFSGMSRHREYEKAADRLAERGIRTISRRVQKQIMARILLAWVIDIRATREEALLHDRVVNGVKHSENSTFALICGRAIRCWAFQAANRRGIRKMLHMVQVVTRRKILQNAFLRLLHIIKTGKRHFRLISSSQKSHTRILLARTLSCMLQFMVKRRMLRFVLERKMRLYKSRLLMYWQQAANAVHLALTFDNQRHTAYQYCARQQYKRGARHFLHQWINHLEQSRLWSKFLVRIARKWLSQMLQAWRAFLVSQRLYDRTMQSARCKWLLLRLRAWSSYVEDCRLHDHARVADGREWHVRAILRAWTLVTSRRKHKLHLSLRLLRRRQHIIRKRTWAAWSGNESKTRALRMGLNYILESARYAFVLWRQAALLVPTVSVYETLNRLPHRSFLLYVLKQLRKYCRRLQMAMFKYHPQLKLMRAWTGWKDGRRRVMMATCVSDAVIKTAQCFYLSAVMRQWLHAVIEPASAAQEALQKKIGRMVLSKHFAALLDNSAYAREVVRAGAELQKVNVLRAALGAYRDAVATRKVLRCRCADAVRMYERNLLAVYFFGIKDEVLEGLLIDESVQYAVRDKARTAFLRSGFIAFIDIWQDSRIFLERANSHRQQHFRSKLLAVCFETLREEFDDRRQKRHAEAESRLKSLYHRFLMGVSFQGILTLCLAEKEAVLQARSHLDARCRKQAHVFIVDNLKMWVKHSRALEQQALQKSDVSLLRWCFTELLSLVEQNPEHAMLNQLMHVRRQRRLHHAFIGFVSRLRRRQLLYQAHVQVRRNHRTRLSRLTWIVWCDTFRRRMQRNKGLLYLIFRRRLFLCKKTIYAWFAIWLQQVNIGIKLLNIRNRAFLLHFKTPVLNRWKQFCKHKRRLSLVCYRKVTMKTLQRVRSATSAWRFCVVKRALLLRKIEGMLIRSKCITLRKCMLTWHRTAISFAKHATFSSSKYLEFCRRHFHLWRTFCTDQHAIQERARTYSVIIKSLRSRLRHEALTRAFANFASNLFGARFMACSLHRRFQWMQLRGLHGSLLRRAFLTWRRHWIERQQLGEALRRVLGRRRCHPNLRIPFGAMLWYAQDRKNIRREKDLVRTTAGILAEILEVFGKPMYTDFVLRAERAVTIDDLIVPLRTFEQHHSHLKASAKLANAAPPRVVSYGPLPYSHHVTTIGKGPDVTHMGLSPSALITPRLPYEAPSVSGLTGRLDGKYLGDSFRNSQKYSSTSGRAS